MTKLLDLLTRILVKLDILCSPGRRAIDAEYNERWNKKERRRRNT